VAFGLMADFDSRGTWKNGSMRFLHCVCKMLDQDMPSLMGTTLLTSVRAVKGWWTCDEKVLESDTAIPVAEFEDWGSISLGVWENARQRRIERIKRRIPKDSETFNRGNHRFQVFYHVEQIFEDKQFDVVILDSDFDSVGWRQIRAYTQTHQIVLEDLFVKPEHRRCGIGSKLLQEMEDYAFSDPEFLKISNIITVPIPRVDVYIQYETVKQFFEANRYNWRYTSALPDIIEYAVFSAVKEADATQEGRTRKRKSLPLSSSPVLPVVRFVRPWSDANCKRYLTVSLVISATLAYGDRKNIQVVKFEGKQFLKGVTFRAYDGIQISEGATLSS